MPYAEYYSIRNTETAERARRRQRAIALIIMVLSVLTASISVTIFGSIREQFNLSEASASDNRTWVIAQLQVDLLNYTLALDAAAADPGDAQLLSRIRRQFDILFSRISLISNAPGKANETVRARPEWQALVGESGLVQAALPLIDGPAEHLVAALPELQAAAHAQLEPIRNTVVDSVATMMGEGDRARSELRAALKLFGLAILWLSICLAGLMVSLYLQGRQQTRHAKILEIAVHNLRTTLDSSLDAVMLVNRGGQIVGANHSCHRILGDMALESRPSLTSFLRDPGDPSQPVHFAALIPGERRRIKALRANGTSFPAEISLASARSGDGHDVSVVFLRDISDQVSYEEGLAAARHAAEAADEAKARFLAVMSHEMRTPLNGLLSATDLLDRSAPLTSEQRWFIDIIRGCGHTALEQVNNVLHLTRMGSADGGNFPAATVSLPQALLGMAQQFSADAARQGTAITVTGDLKPDFAVSIQLQSLRRALSNLLSNAVKFTEDGTITLRLERFASDRPGHVGLRIAVEDTGIGIAEENLDRIFRNFETLDSSFARVHEGSGLGLGIAKLSAEALHGRIEAHSSLGEGSRFTLVFEAPLTDLPPRDVAEAGPTGHHLDGYSVLLAEDNAINRALMRRQLEGLGLQVTEATDGIEAVERARTQDFDVILMDVSMPRMDGLTATAQIRRGQRQPEVPIIAVTAQASPERVQQFRAAQLNEVLTKPARVEELAAIILRFCAARRSPAGSDAAPDPAPDFIEPEVLTPLAQDEILAQLRADMEPAFLAGMVRQFREDGHAAITATAAALKAGDLARVQVLSHRFAGGAAVLGLLALRNALCDQEDAARDGQSRRAEQLQAAIPPLFTRSLAHLDRALGLARA